MEAFANIISLISGFLYSYILIALLIAAGLYLENRFASSRKKERTGNPFPLFRRLWSPPPPVSEPATWSA